MDINTRFNSAKSYAKCNHYIIISESVDSVDWPTREAVREALFQSYPEMIESLIVAKEDFNSGIGIVFKILIRFEKTEEFPQGILTSRVKKDLLEHNLFQNKDWVFDTATCKNVDRAVLAITRYDFDCLHYGHNRDSFHARWIEANLCIKTMGKEWNPCHPVVADVASKGKASLDSLQNRWTHHEQMKVKLIKRRKIVNNYRGWHWQFVNAWNSEIDRLNPRKDPSARAKQQLQEFPKAFYIWGLTGAFKTSFVKWIFGNNFFFIIYFHKYKLNLFFF